jgi:hypothetical protein
VTTTFSLSGVPISTVPAKGSISVSILPLSYFLGERGQSRTYIVVR